ncbi:MAG: crossover junction endodeoxyribonuclease RuvC [Steroidobacteraceae bacterium]
MPRYASRSWRSFDPDAVVSRAVVRVAAVLPRRVLGLDPGSIRMGFGVIDCNAGGEVHVASGCIRSAGADLAGRLRNIHEQVLAIVMQFEPDEIAIERVFMHRNADSALKLGQARGAALSAAVAQGAAVYEYAPRAIKLAVVGSGAADKAQVSRMVQVLLAIGEPATADISDALAIALCHVQNRRAASRLALLESTR